MKRFEDKHDVLAELRRRGYSANLQDVVGAMNSSGLFAPLGPGDLPDLIGHLPSKKRRRNQRGEKLRKFLGSPQWGYEVAAARRRLFLPNDGISMSEARIWHDALLDTLAGTPQDLRVGQSIVPALEYWEKVIREARVLTSQLSLDPSPLDRLRKDWAAGRASFLMGVRKLLDPEGVFKVRGRALEYRADDTDRVIGHLLWGSALCIGELSPGPRVRYSWERMPDGGGRLYGDNFDIDKATASELRVFMKTLRGIRRQFKRRALLSLPAEGSWDERWRKWNHIYPDLASPSRDALRKAVANEVRRTK